MVNPPAPLSLFFYLFLDMQYGNKQYRSRPLDTPLTIKYAQNALSTNSPQMRAICAAAKNNRISVCLGYAEREDADSGFGSLYISQCLIAAEDGEIKMVRRKIKPTHMERTVFGEGGGGSLRNVVGVKAVEEGEGKGEGVVVRVGCLACWVCTLIIVDLLYGESC